MNNIFKLFMKKKIICIILAKNNSSGLPNKNKKLFYGKPLLHYTIKAVKESNIFDKIILSTDSNFLKRYAEKNGVEVPFLRPKKLATKSSPAMDAIQHALKWVKKNDKIYDYVQYIFPANPLIESDDIKNGLKLLIKKDCDMIISLSETHKCTLTANKLKKSLSIKNFYLKKFRLKNRQLMPKTYSINGTIYIGKWDIFYKKKDWLEQNTYAMIMPQNRSVDIDNFYDFEIAKLMYKLNKKK